jgi:PAS domain S-box-containing protein
VAVFTGELVVISGRYKGHRIPLSKEVIRIGRDRTCEIALDDEAASRVHSEVVRGSTGFLLRDLRSTNGTYLNGARISESPLQNGDRVGVGDTIMLMQVEEDSSHKTLPMIVFPKDKKGTSARYRLSLNDTRFLELHEGTTIPDAQRHFTRLYEFNNDIAGILHLPALLERALTQLFNAFTPDRAVILLLTPDGQPGVKVAKLREGIAGNENISISRTMAHQLLELKESILSIDAASDERLAAAKSLHQMRVMSVMGVPLKVKDKIVGMIYLDTIGSGQPFAEMDLKLCTAMALQLAICIENTRLYTELLDAAEFNNSVLRSLASGVIVVDSVGRVLRINEATQSILERDESQLIGHTLSEDPELGELSRVIQLTLSSGHNEDRYEVLVRAGSKTIPLGLSTSVLADHTGKAVGVVANFRNLAGIRKLEEQVRRSHHLAALGQMAAGVAHEIRNPLNSIRGFAQLVQEGTAKDAKLTEYTQIILEEVDRMNRIVQDLLDFSRQRDLTLLPLSMSKLLSELINEMQSDAKQVNVTLAMTPEERVLPNVFGNSDKLRQVFRNIILNALQACKAGGRVIVRMGLAESQGSRESKQDQAQNGGAEVRPNRREITASIEDDGCGIDLNVISKIFDPFFTQKDSGTGLGLSISQKIVEQHGGRIEVRSEVGKGSTFTVFLPAV